MGRCARMYSLSSALMPPSGTAVTGILPPAEGADGLVTGGAVALGPGYSGCFLCPQPAAVSTTANRPARYPKRSALADGSFCIRRVGFDSAAPCPCDPQD